MRLRGARSRLGILSSSKPARDSPCSRSDFRAWTGFSGTRLQNIHCVYVDHHVLRLSLSLITQHVPRTEDLNTACQIHERKQAEKSRFEWRVSNF